MNTLKNRIIHYINDRFYVEPEYLWSKYPEYAVFRHKDNNKWFAVILLVKKCKLGLDGEEMVYILDIKGDSIINGSLIMNDGIFPGYHMNKQTWLSVLLDGTVMYETICDLLEMSYDLTKNKTTK